MKLYNSYTLKTEEFKPIEEGKVSMYVCGPTVYNHAHIGNARPIVVFDTLRRTFEALGYKVKFVSNFTDVDDKIINKALEEGVSEKEIAERYIKAYNDVRNSLNIIPLDVTPRVTETMDEIIEFIDRLVKKGNAYVVDGDVYFSVNPIRNTASCLISVWKISMPVPESKPTISRRIRRTLPCGRRPTRASSGIPHGVRDVRAGTPSVSS